MKSEFTLRDARRVFFSEASPWLLTTIAFSAWVGRLVYGGALGLEDALIAIAVVVYWPFQEWWMHRWLLHMKPIRIGSFSYEPLFAKMHREHHERPESMDRIPLPLRHVVAAGLVFFGLGFLIFRDVGYACSLLGTAAFSTLLYEWTHFLTHTKYKPKSAYYRRIWRLHRWHHYKNEHYWFSFTFPFWDAWLGTGPRPNDVKRSGTARTLRALTEDEVL